MTREVKTEPKVAAAQRDDPGQLRVRLRGGRAPISAKVAIDTASWDVGRHAPFGGRRLKKRPHASFSDGEPRTTPRESETFAFVLALIRPQESFSRGRETVELFQCEGMDGAKIHSCSRNVQRITSDAREDRKLRQPGPAPLPHLGARRTSGPSRSSLEERRGLSPAAWNGDHGRRSRRRHRARNRATHSRFALGHPLFARFQKKRTRPRSMTWSSNNTTGQGVRPDKVLPRWKTTSNSPMFIRSPSRKGRSSADVDDRLRVEQRHPAKARSPVMGDLCRYISSRHCAATCSSATNHLDLPVERTSRPFILETPTRVRTLSGELSRKRTRSFPAILSLPDQVGRSRR